MLVRNSAGIPTATFELLPSKMCVSLPFAPPSWAELALRVKIRVRVNAIEHWAPGQHCFFNFFACAPLTSCARSRS
jgi:hypothetical protein